MAGVKYIAWNENTPALFFGIYDNLEDAQNATIHDPVHDPDPWKPNIVSGSDGSYYRTVCYPNRTPFWSRQAGDGCTHEWLRTSDLNGPYSICKHCRKVRS